MDYTRWNVGQKDRESAREWLFADFVSADKKVQPYTLQWVLMHLPEVDSPEFWAERIRAAVQSDDAPERFLRMADGRGLWRGR